MSGKDSIVIAGAARTPVGSFGGSLGKRTRPLSRADGHQGGAGARRRGGRRGFRGHFWVRSWRQVRGQNPARQASIGAGIPVEAPAWGINQLCGSGLRSVALGAQQIELGGSDIVVAGGQESMSQAPHCAYLRDGKKMGGLEMVDTMLKDGLFDAFNGYHMGVTAENVARQWQITRDEQDQFAVASQNKAEAARRPASSRTRSSRSP